MRNSILLNRRNIGINIEMNCTYVSLGLLLLFLCNLGSIHGHFIRFAARCLFGVVFLHKAKQGRVTVCNSQISPASKTSAPIHRKSAKSLRPGQSHISSPRHRYCDVFFVGNVFESFWFWAIRRALRNFGKNVLCGEREHGLGGSCK